MKPLRTSRFATLLALALAACGMQTGGEAPATDPCTVQVTPGGDDQVAIQSALLGAATGSVVCLEAGTYHLSDGLSLGVPGLTLRAMERGVTLDFDGQRAPAPGLNVSGDDVSLEGIELRNSKGSALRVVGADNVRIMNVRIAWDEGASSDDVRGLSLIQASNSLVKDVEVVGARGAGIHSEGSVRLVIDGASLRGNGTGINIVGGSDLEIVGTDLQANGAGILAAMEEPLGRLKIHNNLIEGSSATHAESDLFGGMGMAVLGPFVAEIHGNTVRGNDGAGLLVVPPIDPLDENHGVVHVHDNRFESNGRRTEEAGEKEVESIDILLMGTPSGVCLEENVGQLVARGTASEASPDGGCPMIPLPSLSL